jgi:hypothetical protein
MDTGLRVHRVSCNHSVIFAVVGAKGVQVDRSARARLDVRVSPGLAWLGANSESGEEGTVPSCTFGAAAKGGECSQSRKHNKSFVFHLW